MYFGTEEKDERILFSYEERKAALKRSGGICACCGKKLTTKTMTMDHIIPLWRGGKNEADNVIALCESCNKEKGSILFLPNSFYMAMEGKPEQKKMQKYVEDWFDSVKDQFDIAKFPLIAPRTNQQVKIFGSKYAKNMVYQPQLIVQWKIMNREYYDEIEAVTELNTKSLRMDISKFHTFTETGNEVPIAAIYTLRKITNDKILALAVVQLAKEKRHINIWFPWCDMAKKWQAYVVMRFVRQVLHCVVNMAGIEINTYTVRCCEEAMLDEFTKSKYMDSFTGRSYRTVKKRTDIAGHAIFVDRLDYDEIRKNAMQRT